MTPAVAVALTLAAPLLGVLGPLVAVLAVVSWLFSGTSLSVDGAPAMAAAGLALAVPASAMLAGELVERTLHWRTRLDSLRHTAAVLAAALMLHPRNLAPFLVSALETIGERGAAGALGFSLSIVNAGLFCAALVTIVLVGSVAAIELPVAFCLRAARSPVYLPLKAARGVLALGIVCFGLDVIAAAFAREFWPPALVSSAWR